MNSPIEDLTAELAAMQDERDAALLDRDKAEGENASLRVLFPAILTALGNGGACAPDASIEFLQWVPKEVRLVVARLTTERDQARAEAAANAELLKLVRQDLADYHKLDDDRISIAMIRIDTALAAIGIRP